MTNSNSNSDAQEGRSLDFIKWGFVVTLVMAAVLMNHFFDDVWVLYRALGLVVALAVAAVTALQTTKGKDFVEFSKESRTEVRKVIWPSRQEATNTTLIVFVVTLLAGLVLWGLDSLLGMVVNLILGI